jgi:hypothetical protein
MQHRGSCQRVLFLRNLMMAYSLLILNQLHYFIVSGGTLNTWRSGDDGRTVAERLQVRF